MGNKENKRERNKNKWNRTQSVSSYHMGVVQAKNIKKPWNNGIEILRQKDGKRQ